MSIVAPVILDIIELPIFDVELKAEDCVELEVVDAEDVTAVDGVTDEAVEAATVDPVEDVDELTLLTIMHLSNGA
jgi:hypothetical protein